jgi:hypothetical protein
MKPRHRGVSLGALPLAGVIVAAFAAVGPIPVRAAGATVYLPDVLPGLSLLPRADELTA